MYVYCICTGRVLRISVRGVQIFRTKVLPLVRMFLLQPLDFFRYIYNKLNLFRAKRKQNNTSECCIIYLFNKPVLSVKGLSIFFKGEGQDSLPAGGRFPGGKLMGGKRPAAPPHVYAPIMYPVLFVGRAEPNSITFFR